MKENETLEIKVLNSLRRIFLIASLVLDQKIPETAFHQALKYAIPIIQGHHMDIFYT